MQMVFGDPKFLCILNTTLSAGDLIFFFNNIILVFLCLCHAENDTHPISYHGRTNRWFLPQDFNLSTTSPTTPMHSLRYNA